MTTRLNRIDTDHICALYRTYAGDLRAARAAALAFLTESARGFTAQLDDIEAEITYLLLRERRPGLICELGTLHGWSTSWILRALRDNGTGFLRSFDLSDRVLRSIPEELSAGRWEFTKGDIRETVPKLPAELDYLFVDANHGGRFGRWYVSQLLSPFDGELTVSVHDVFHGKRAKPFSEGKVVLDWLATRELPYFTAARAREPGVFATLNTVRAEIGITEDIKKSKANPMIYFQF